MGKKMPRSELRRRNAQIASIWAIKKFKQKNERVELVRKERQGVARVIRKGNVDYLCCERRADIYYLRISRIDSHAPKFDKLKKE